MPKSTIDSKKVVVLSGAGLSAASGLATFRSSGGLWEKYRIEDVASPRAWERDPGLVLQFYNQLRTEAATAQPNAGHLAIAELQERFEVIVVTQNVDDLHERAGSRNVIHVHGELTKARSTFDDSVHPIGSKPISLGDLCPAGGQLRPHIVWFGEEVMRFDEARRHFEDSGKVLVVGTSLSVFPAAGLVERARFSAEKVLVDVDPTKSPFGFRIIKGAAAEVLPALTRRWLAQE